MILCARFPYFPTTVEQRDDPALRRRPLVLGGRAWQRAEVYAMSHSAALAGVRPGLTLRRAQALIPEALFRPPTPLQYNGVALALLDRLHDWTPRVEPRDARPALLYYVDLDGEAPRAAAGTARQIGEALRATAGFAPAVGAAGNRFAAWLAARTAQPGRLRTLPGDEEARALIQAYPLAALRLPPALAERLALFGLTTLGQLAALPAGEIATQFGRHGAVLYRLARGDDPRPVQPPPAAPTVRRTCRFDEPTADGELLGRVLVREADALAAQAGETVRMGATAWATADGVQLELDLADGRRGVQRAVLPPPAQAAPLPLTRALAGLLGRAAPSAPVAALTVVLLGVRPPTARPLTLFAAAEKTAPDGSAADRAAARTQLTAQYGARLFAQVQAADPADRLWERRYLLLPVPADDTNGPFLA